jgi:hypothetical protein
MTFVTDSISTLTGWLRAASELGMTLVLTFVLIDVLFPGTTGVLTNLSAVVGGFAKEGLAGLIALLLFLVLVKK